MIAAAQERLHCGQRNVEGSALHDHLADSAPAKLFQDVMLAHVEGSMLTHSFWGLRGQPLKQLDLNEKTSSEFRIKLFTPDSWHENPRHWVWHS